MDANFRLIRDSANPKVIHIMGINDKKPNQQPIKGIKMHVHSAGIQRLIRNTVEIPVHSKKSKDPVMVPVNKKSLERYIKDHGYILGHECNYVETLRIIRKNEGVEARVEQKVATIERRRDEAVERLKQDASGNQRLIKDLEGTLGVAKISIEIESQKLVAVNKEFPSYFRKFETKQQHETNIAAFEKTIQDTNEALEAAKARGRELAQSIRATNVRFDSEVAKARDTDAEDSEDSEADTVVAADGAGGGAAAVAGAGAGGGGGAGGGAAAVAGAGAGGGRGAAAVAGAGAGGPAISSKQQLLVDISDKASPELASVLGTFLAKFDGAAVTSWKLQDNGEFEIQFEKPLKLWVKNPQFQEGVVVSFEQKVKGKIEKDKSITFSKGYNSTLNHPAMGIISPRIAKLKYNPEKEEVEITGKYLLKSETSGRKLDESIENTAQTGEVVPDHVSPGDFLKKKQAEH
jgi:hypothetical protein